MVRVSVRVWVMRYAYGGPHKERSTGVYERIIFELSNTANKAKREHD